MVRTSPSEGMPSRGRVRSTTHSLSSSHSSGSQYALCTLGMGFVALGVVMIIWTMVPIDLASNGSSSNPTGSNLNSQGKTSSIAIVLVSVGIVLLIIAICLAVRNKRRQQIQEPPETSPRFLSNTAEEPAEAVEELSPAYDVPSYEEAVGSGQYPIRQSNLRMSSSQLPSYEDLEGATHNEAGPQEAPAPTPAAAPAPARRTSRASRLLLPLRVRRIVSEKLHQRDVRLNIQGQPPEAPVTIEPLTPPPQYDEKMPELKD